MTLDREPLHSFRFSTLLPACALLLAVACHSEKKSETEVAALAPATTTASAPAAQPAAMGAPGATTPKGAEPGALTELTVDPATSKLAIVASKITRSHDGSFQQFTGTATLAGDQVQSVIFDVDTASLQTDTEKLTQHIKTKDFLDVEKFPKATFKSTRVVAKPAGAATHEITGDLTLHGVTQQITFPATIEFSAEKITGHAEIAINRQKFGVTYPGMPDDLIKDEILIRLRIKAKKAA